MKIALFNSIDREHESTPCIFTEKVAQYTVLVRISEYVDVEFPPRPLEEMLPAAVAALDEQISKTRIENERRLQLLESRRANLLALPAKAAALETDEVPF